MKSCWEHKRFSLWHPRGKHVRPAVEKTFCIIPYLYCHFARAQKSYSVSLVYYSRATAPQSPLHLHPCTSQRIASTGERVRPKRLQVCILEKYYEKKIICKIDFILRSNCTFASIFLLCMLVSVFSLPIAQVFLTTGRLKIWSNMQK